MAAASRIGAERQQEDWQGYTHHPFVEGLRDGTLPRRCFVSYLIQDYVFLVHFARAWSMAVVKSETLGRDEDLRHHGRCAGQS